MIFPLSLAALSELWRANLLSPPILFFFLGLVAAGMRSDLRIPKAFVRTMSLYLLFTIGFAGGVKLREHGLSNEGIAALIAALVLSATTPLYVFPMLRRTLGVATSAGVAATYGSVSAVTFLAASAMLTQKEIAYGGHMVAAMALMEFPAIVVGVMLGRLFHDPAKPGSGTPSPHDTKSHGLLAVVRESCTNGSVVLLVGSMAVGVLTTSRGAEITAPLWKDLFYGVLCFYLLDLGLIAGRNAKHVIKAGWPVVVFALVFPLCNAMVGAALARVLHLPFGDGFLIMVMAASASYIAAPAALRLALPEAKASVYVPMALTLTFPLNILLGLPLYWAIAERLLHASPAPMAAP
jgi:uncharacterized protein